MPPNPTETPSEAAKTTTVSLEAFTSSKLPAGSDPVLKEVSLAAKTVDNSDNCTFNTEYVKKLPIFVRWKEWARDKEDTYYVIGFNNTTMSSSTP